MATKLKISDMLAYYIPHAVVTNTTIATPHPDQIGYVMGGDGRIATDAYIKSRAKSSYGAAWEDYYNCYKKWVGHQVVDCNAVAEHYYKTMTGQNIDTKARYNYSNWCGRKDVPTRDNALANMPQLPGVALFSGSSNSSSGITHVGFLLCKYGSGLLDWWVLEARGKNYGLVITRLKDRAWEWWGVMDKYYIYDLDVNYAPPVKPLIGNLNAIGTVSTGNPATVDVPLPASTASFFATCSGGRVNVRKGRGTENPIIGVADKGECMLALPAVNGWNEVAVEVSGKIITGYMSGTYVKKQ